MEEFKIVTWDVESGEALSTWPRLPPLAESDSGVTDEAAFDFLLLLIVPGSLVFANINYPLIETIISIFHRHKFLVIHTIQKIKTIPQKNGLLMLVKLKYKD